MASSSSLSFLSSTFFTPTTTSPSTSSLKSSLSLRFLPSYTKTSKHQPTIIAQAATLPVLNFEGEKVGETTLDIHTAPPETARAVVHRGLITDLQNKRRGTASTLTRGEVSGGGRKPYPQKKTGRARRGSMRTPLMPGGGVIFGPKPKDWSVKINRKEKRLALSTAIASAAAGSAIVVEEFGDKFEDKPKTKEFLAAMGRWGIDPKEKSMFFMMDLDENVVKSSRNIGTLKMLNPRSLNLFDVLDSEKLVFTQAAVDYLNYTYGYEDEELEDGEGAWEIVEEEEEEKGSALPESSES